MLDKLKNHSHWPMKINPNGKFLLPSNYTHRNIGAKMKGFCHRLLRILPPPPKAIKRDSPFTISRFEMSQYTNTKWVHPWHIDMFSRPCRATPRTKFAPTSFPWGMPYQQLTTKSENERFGHLWYLHYPAVIPTFPKVPWVPSHVRYTVIFCFKFAGRFLTRQKGCAMRGQ